MAQPNIPGLEYADQAPTNIVADTTDNTAAGGAGVQVTGQGSKYMPKLAGTTALGPEQTAELLANMQNLIAQKTGPMAQFMSGVQDALAYAQPYQGGQMAAALQYRNEQKRKELEDLMAMQSTMATYKGAEAQRQLLDKMDQASGWGVPQVGGTQQGVASAEQGISDITPAEIAQYNELKLTDPVAARKFKQTLLENAQKARVGLKYAPAQNDIVEVGYYKPDGSLGTRQMLRKDAIRVLGPQEASTLPPAVTQGAAGPQDAREAIKRGIFGQESGSGTADTSKPNAQGVQGPMQIKDTTFDYYQKLGVIPKNFKIDNAYQNKKAGDLIVDYLYDQHGGDTRKVAAEYYGGPGAINKDGTINVSRRNVERPQDPTIGQYIDQVHQKAGMSLPGVAAQAPQIRPTAAAAPAPAYNVASTQPVAAPSALPSTSALGGVPQTMRMPGTAGPIDIAEARAAGKVAEETALAKIEGEKELSRGGGKATNELFRFADEASRLRPLLKKVREHADKYADEFAVASRPGTTMGAATIGARILGGAEGREFVEENLPSTLIRPGAKERRDETASAATQIGIKAIPDMFSGNGSVRVGAQISNLVQSGKGLGVGLSAQANKQFSEIAEIGLDRAEMMANAVKELRKTNPKATVDDLPQSTLWKIDDWTEKQFEERGVIAKLPPKEAAAEELRKRKIRNVTGTGAQ